jgi:uncharacterized repeat protein (TIGR01451 family)
MPRMNPSPAGATVARSAKTAVAPLGLRESGVSLLGLAPQATCRRPSGPGFTNLLSTHGEAKKTRKMSTSTFVALMCAAGLLFAHAAFADDGMWTRLEPMPTPRRLLAAAAEGGKIYTFGGCGSPCFEPPLHTSTLEETRVEVYEPPPANRWRQKQPMTAILFGAAAAAPGNGKIYTFGGYVTGNLTQEYDPAADTWTKKRSMPTARYGLAAVALDGKIYVLGGSDGKAPSDALEIYDPDNDSWTPGTRMPTARVFLAAAVLDKKIYAIGGSPDCCGNSQTAAVEIYDTVAKTWTTGAPTWTTGAPLLVAEQTSAAASVNGKIYVFGGFIPGTGTQKTTFEYDQGSWSRKADMPTPRDQAPAVAVDGVVYVIGGAVNCHCSALGENEQFMPPPPKPQETADLSVMKTDGKDRVCVGESVAYDVTVRNDGPAGVVGAGVKDEFTSNLRGVQWRCKAPRGTACTAPDLTNSRGPLSGTVNLPAGRELHYEVTGTVAAGAAVTNTASISPPTGVEDPDLDDNVKPDTDAVVDLTLEVEALSATCGGALSYTLVVTNRGAATGDVQVTAQTPPELTPLPPVDQHCHSSSAGIVCTLSRLAAGAIVKFPVSFTIPECYAGPIPVVAFLEPDCGEISISVPLVCKADLAIEKTGPVCVNPGSSYSYSLKVTNLGPDCACDAGVIDSNPRNFVSETLPSGCKDEEGRLVACAIGKLCPGDLARTFQLDFTLSPAAPLGSTLVNTADVVDASTMDPDRSNNSATTSASVPCCPLTITKTVDATMAMPGQTLHYTIVVSNPGSENVAAATVTDLFPTSLFNVRWCRDTTQVPCTPSHMGDLHDTIALAAGDSATYRAQAIVDLKFIGKLENTASISAPNCTRASTAMTEIGFTGVKAFCTDISGQFLTGTVITKRFLLINGGPFIQMDNPGDEFTDVLPSPDLTLTGVSADSGTTAMVGNTATWNGAIPVGGMVMITITATINAPVGTLICNQALISFDTDGDGLNDTNAASDDPNEPGMADPCCFRVLRPDIPALSIPGLLALALLLAGLAVLRLRGRSL